MTRASATAFWLCLTIIVSLGLYHTSYRVDNLDGQLQALNKKIQLEQRTIHVLKAEWDFLSNPSRIEAVARKHLDLQPTNPKQITLLKKLSSFLPTHKEAYRLAQRKARRALARTHAAAHTPRASSYEKDRLNKRIVFKQTAQNISKSSLKWTHKNAYTLANTGGRP